MAFERTYQHAWNVAPADNSTIARMSASQLFFILQALTGNLTMTDIGQNPIGTILGKWTVAGSGNGSAGAMDGVDRIGLSSAFNFSNWVNGTAGNPHTWMCLKTPAVMGGPGVYLIISWSNGSGVNYFSTYWAKTLPTSGSATADPTTTDATQNLTKQLNDGTLNHNFSAKLSTVGDLEMYSQKVGAGQAHFCLGFWNFAQAEATDTVPYGEYCEFNSSAPGPMGAGALHSTGNWASRYTDNSGSNGSGPSSYGAFTPQGIFGPIESSFASTGDGLTGKILEWPFGIYSTTSTVNGNTCYRGRIPDIYIGGLSGTNAKNGYVNPASPAVPTTTILGSVITPCNTAPIL